jgi:hypothetical protein
MFGCCGYSISCIPRKDILVCQLCCGQFLPLGLLCLVGSQVLRVAPNLLCITVVVESLLQVALPTVGLYLLPSLI